ncbi:MAG: iron ABC transporter permease [Lentisphaeria bacterium]|nr:iron ABC transporter permease [Lentisphaeria bacterium]
MTMKRDLFYFIAVLLTGGLGLCAGSFWIAPSGLDSDLNAVIVEMRALRMAAAFTVGGSLALSGLIFQALLRNPLAEPFTLGLSGGAATGAALAFLTGIATAGLVPVNLCAFAGAMAVLAFVLLTARGSRENLLLTGVITGTVMSGLLMFLLSHAENTEQLAGITWWMLGDLQAPDRTFLFAAAVLLLIATACVRFFAGDMDALSLGTAQAHDLGVQTKPVMLFLTALAALLAAGTVVLAGIIGFCGLVIPHIIRRLHGQSHRNTVLCTVLCGGLFLMVCDILSRLGEIREIPIGVITALSGGPFFLWLLNRKPERG